MFCYRVSRLSLCGNANNWPKLLKGEADCGVHSSLDGQGLLSWIWGTISRSPITLIDHSSSKIRLLPQEPWASMLCKLTLHWLILCAHYSMFAQLSKWLLSLFLSGLDAIAYRLPKGRHLELSVTLCKTQVEREVGVKKKWGFYKELCKFRLLTSSLLIDYDDDKGIDDDYNGPSENILVFLPLECTDWPTLRLTTKCTFEKSQVKAFLISLSFWCKKGTNVCVCACARVHVHTCVCMCMCMYVARG